MPSTMNDDAVGGGLAVFAGAARGGKLVRADNVLGTEVARAQAVGSADKVAALQPGVICGKPVCALNGF